MKITVERFTSGNDATTGLMFVDGKFVCFTLEDEHRAEKVAGETRIPAGEYAVKLRTEGGFHNRYSGKFADMHQGMLHLQDVPGFEYILIHIGNTEKDTAGCLLVGTTATPRGGAMSIGSSVKAYKKLYPLVVGAAKDENLTLTVIDRDRGV